MSRSNIPAIGNSQWMLSFADLLSLILTFFVLIYSMAQPMQQANMYKHEFDSLNHPESDINFSKIQVEKFDTQLTSEYLENVFRSKEDSALQNIGIKADLNKFVLSIPTAQINDTVIDELVEAIRVYENKKHVYSDNLDTSKSIADRLEKKGITQGLGFYEEPEIKDRIDIIIYL